ncbi:MAG: citrate synthase [Pseudonocardia sp.]|nr:citrate synthase [Pseudonocardia sp.]
MTEERFLTTAEAARRLDVKPETIYAYVSRGLLTSIRSGARRGSLFAQADVDRLAVRGREGRAPSGAIERIRTGITLLEDDELYFRGRRATELAGRASFESVARLLWTGELARAPEFHAPAGSVATARAAVAALPPTAELTDRVRVAVAAAGASDPLRHDLSPDVVVRRAEGLIAVLAEALPARDGSDGVAGGAGGAASVAARLWPALSRRPTPADPADVDLLDLLLILLADHDLAVSTLAARLAASARANPYAVVSAGLGAIDGQYHGGASALAHRFLGEALQDPVRALSDRLRTGSRVPGFGHRVYRRRDPRAERLFAVLRDRDPDAPVLRAVDRVVEGVAERPGVFPNIDLALAALAHMLDLRADVGEAVFAVARTAGWIAHALEEYREPGLRFRPEGLYTGPRP